MDGYGTYPGYPANATPDYNASNLQRPPSQTNSQSPHPGMYCCGDMVPGIERLVEAKNTHIYLLSFDWKSHNANNLTPEQDIWQLM